MNAKRIFLGTSNMFTNVPIVVLMTKRIFKARCQIKTTHIAENMKLYFFPRHHPCISRILFFCLSRRMNESWEVDESSSPKLSYLRIF